MARPGGEPNLASLNVEPGVLQIEEQVFRSTPTLMEEVEHELSAYYSGAPPNRNIPRLGESRIFAHNLLEWYIRDGKWPSILPPPRYPALPRLLAALGLLALKYPPKNDRQAKDLLHIAQKLGIVIPAISDPFLALLDGLAKPEPKPKGAPGTLYFDVGCIRPMESTSMVCWNNLYFKASRDVTLSEVAQFAYRDWQRWTVIYAANQELIGPNPNVGVRKGQVLYIP